MSQTYPLDIVIREVQVSPRSIPDSAKIILFDTKNRKVVEKKGLFSVNIKSFLVSNVDDDKQNFAEGEGPTIPVEDFKKKRTIGLITYYRLSCPKGNEGKVVKALSGGLHPTDALESKIKKWATEFLHENETEFIDEFLSKQGELEEFISRRAKEDAGLNLSLRTELEEKSLELFYINKDFPVVACDYDNVEQYINARIELDVDQNNIINAVLALSRLPKLEKKTIDEIKKFISRHVTLQQIYFNLNDDSLKNRLTAQLDKCLKVEGRKVKRITFEFRDKDELKKLKTFFQTKDEIEVECSIREYPTPVIIKNRLQMELEDVVNYKKKGSKELEKWIGQNLEEIIHKFLFEIKYIDLLLNFKPIEEKIRNELKLRAREIGYHLKLLIAVPNLKQRELISPFTIENADQLEFTTKNSRYKVKLKIVVRVRIKDLKDIENLLNRQADVEKEMKEAILDEASQYIHSIDPKHFYINFEFSEDEKKCPPVNKTLKAKISARLKKDFKAEIINIRLQNIDTAITKRFYNMNGELCDLRIEVEPLGGDEEVVFIGTFRVVSVDVEHWDDFLACEYSLESIRKKLEEHLRDKLKYVKNNELLHNKYSEAEQFKLLASNLVSEFAANNFGLTIQVVSFSRVLTAREKLRFDVNRDELKSAALKGKTVVEEKKKIEEKMLSAKSEELDELLKKRKALITLDENEKELQEIDAKIDDTIQRLTTHCDDAKKERVDSLKSESGGSSLKELIALSLPERKEHENVLAEAVNEDEMIKELEEAIECEM